MRGTVIIRGLKVFAFHGCLPEEKEKGQDFYVDLEIDYDMGPAAEADALPLALDYDALTREVHALVSTERYDLLEALVARVGRLLADKPGVERALVRVRKPQAPLIHPVEWVGVEAEFEA
jgi:7,8-dihydroneopterin aldolase/epimerase/oxygenase